MSHFWNNHGTKFVSLRLVILNGYSHLIEGCIQTLLLVFHCIKLRTNSPNGEKMIS